MDVALTLHALGLSHSSGTLPSPFDRAARYYPSTDLTPFIENAYLRVHNMFGKPIEATFGRQNFRLGSGLLLDDDGAGLTGVTLRGELPFWEMKAEGFFFNDRDINAAAPNNIEYFGTSFELPTDGTWELNELVERSRALRNVVGCSFIDPTSGLPTTGCAIGKSQKSFTSARYQLNFGPMVFDGEAALERGAATPTGTLSPTTPGAIIQAPNHITFQGDAEVVRAKWKQSLYKTGEGIARLSLARGSGDRGDTLTKDEAFFPAHGHRFDGLERSGFGEFFGATPYDAMGGAYYGASTTTVNGLRNGASGIWVVGAGYTPPAYKGWTLDLDYFLFQADRVVSGSRTLGSEWDFRLRYPIQNRFQIAFVAAAFTAGRASNQARGSSKKFAFEASGRF